MIDDRIALRFDQIGMIVSSVVGEVDKTLVEYKDMDAWVMSQLFAPNFKNKQAILQDLVKIIKHLLSELDSTKSKVLAIDDRIHGIESMLEIKTKQVIQDQALTLKKTEGKGKGVGSA